MPHSVTLITTIAAGLGLALIFGFIAVRLKLPALVGYLVAGILIGPHAPGFVADVAIASQLAEIGVMLLMFGVGLHFSMEDLLSVGRIAVPGALVQMLVATALGTGLAMFWGWGIGAGVVLGLALSVASTVVFLKAMESHGAMDSINGRIAIGWLVVQDLIMVLVLVLLPPLAGGNASHTVGAQQPSLLAALAETLGLVAVFIGLMLVVGRRVFPWFLWQVARTGSRELFTLCVIAAAVGIAYVSSAVFGVSFALGAFFAGMVLRESNLSYRAAQESLPLRDAFSVLFFVSVGMLFDPRVLIEMPLHVLAVVGIIVIGKSVVAFALVLAYRYPLNTALTVSASLAQIGEFSFILAGLGTALGVLPVQGQNLILAGALISIAINPLVFQAIEPAQRWIRALEACARSRTAHRSARRTADDRAFGLRHRPCGAGRLRTGRPTHRCSTGRTAAALRGGRREPRADRETARARCACRRGQRLGPGRADPGAYRARLHAGDRDAGHLSCAADDRDRADAQSVHRDRGTHAQRRRGGDAAQ